MKTLLAASVAWLALATPSDAVQVVAFGQTSGSNTVTATTDAGNTMTTLAILDAGVDVTQLLGLVPISGLFFDLNATSIDAAQTVGGAVLQHYSGSFCITSAAGCGGTNVLSGTFSDAAFGTLGGPGLVVNVNNPPDTLALSSSLLAASDLLAPNTFNLGFSNLPSPGVTIVGTTIAPFTASFAGVASASVAVPPVAEPASLAIFGLAVSALGFVCRRGKAVS